ncbi:unnamed protein product [Ambrosiozyma monospora]|uniref:Unnamed protein product n=1 Tax=Ambrosiozyma monospora TaxID=43982 RepID=A0A9W6T1I0_AMBMO|nr:unnamed protein product [Ambrosiozyma monospora]
MELNWGIENGSTSSSVEQFLSNHLDLVSTVPIKRFIIDTNTSVGKVLVDGDFLRLYKRAKEVKIIASKSESFVLGNLQEAKKSSDVAKTITTFEVSNAEALSVLLEDFNNYTNLQRLIIDQEFGDQIIDNNDIETLLSLCQKVKKLVLKLGVLSIQSNEEEELLAQLISIPNLTFDIAALEIKQRLRLVTKSWRRHRFQAIAGFFVDANTQKGLLDFPTKHDLLFKMDVPAVGLDFHSDSLKVLSISQPRVMGCNFTKLIKLDNLIVNSEIDFQSLRTLPQSLVHLTISSHPPVSADAN